MGTRYPLFVGRPKLDDAKNVQIPLKVSGRMAEQIDAARGRRPRGEWVRQLVAVALEAGTPVGAPAPVQKLSAPRPPDGEHAGRG
jgi:hypothetical protein